MLVAAGGNSVVFDIKDRPGDLSYPSEVPLAKSIGASSRSTIERPKQFVRSLQDRGIYVIARVSCFYDRRMARARPEWAPESASQDGPWLQHGRLNWVDPSNPQVQDYLLALVDEVAQMGVDEVQLDYIRFPTEGRIVDAVFDFDVEEVAKEEVISGFLSRTREIVEPRGVKLSADIFGVVAWGRDKDVETTGQSLSLMLPLLDVVSPMLYPSHFYGNFEQLANPAAYP